MKFIKFLVSPCINRRIKTKFGFLEKKFFSLDKIKVLLLTVILLFPYFPGIHSDSKNLAPDVATNIRAKVTEDKNSIEITWTPPVEEGDVILARSRNPIDTADKLYIADSLGILSYNNDIRVNSFKDQNLRPGQYYYAVALVTSVRRRQVELVKDQNFTSLPVTIFEKENAPSQNLDYKKFIKSIDAQKVDNGVKIVWEAPDNAERSKPIYSLYRSTSPLETVSALRNAKKLIELDHPDTSYVDRSKGAVQGVYYGVSVTINEDESIPLTEGISFIKYGEAPKKKAKPKQKEEEEEEEETEPTKKPKKKKVEPTQLPPEEVITDEGLVKKKPLVIKKGYYVHEINIEILKDNELLLTWSQPTNVDLEEVVYSVYQSESPLKNVQNLLDRGKAKKLGEVTHPETKFQFLREASKKIHYYGVTVRLPSGEEFGLLAENDSFLKIYPEGYASHKEKNKDHKEDKKENKKEPSDEKEPPTEEEPPKEDKSKNKKKTSENSDETENNEFNQIMSEYYKKGKYTVAHEKLILLAETATDPKEKGRAYFYAALCQYQKKKYKEALKLLLKEEVQKHYEGDRVEFYINQCIKKRSDG